MRAEQVASGEWRVASGIEAPRARARQVRLTRHSPPVIRHSLEREDIQHPSLGRLLREILHRIHETEGGARITCVETSGDDRAGPAAYARGRRVVLLAAVGVRHRLADDPRASFELP